MIQKAAKELKYDIDFLKTSGRLLGDKPNKRDVLVFFMGNRQIQQSDYARNGAYVFIRQPRD